MPIHDWTRVRANRYHDFHQSWTVALSDALNAGCLSPDHFAMIEQSAGGPGLDAGFVARTDAAIYARKSNRIAIRSLPGRHLDGEVVAVLEIVSPGNKESQHAVDTFACKAFELLQVGVHLLIVDLFPPSRRDPQGIHKVIWDRLLDEPFALPPDKPLTTVSYAVGGEIVAYVEPVAVGDSLPDMPIFLTADRYVPCPLEAAYQTAWEQFPAPLKGPLDPAP